MRLPIIDPDEMSERHAELSVRIFSRPLRLRRLSSLMAAHHWDALPREKHFGAQGLVDAVGFTGPTVSMWSAPRWNS